MAKGYEAGAIGLMILLLVMTIFYMPVVTPLILTEASVSPWDIAKPLIFAMLIPSALALFFSVGVKSKYLSPLGVAFEKTGAADYLAMNIMQQMDGLTTITEITKN